MNGLWTAFLYTFSPVLFAWKFTVAMMKQLALHKEFWIGAICAAVLSGIAAVNMAFSKAMGVLQDLALNPINGDGLSEFADTLSWLNCFADIPDFFTCCVAVLATRSALTLYGFIKSWIPGS